MKIQPVTISQTTGNLVGLSAGVHPGDNVVIDGQDKLQDGTQNQSVAGAYAGTCRGCRKRRNANSDPRRRAPPRWAILPEPGFWQNFRSHSAMSPSRPFILRPVATTLLMIGILLVGFVAYRQLPISALPQVDYPTIQVLTFYPGASPDVMTSSVTAPLERQFGQIPGLNQMTSTSSFGSSIVTLQFVLDLNIDVAEQEVQAAINAASNLLPHGSAEPADLQQDQSSRFADFDAGADFASLAALESGRSGGDHAVAENFAIAAASDWSASAAASGRRCGFRRIPTALASYGLSLEDLRTALRQGQRRSGQGNFRRPASGLHDWRERSAADQRRLSRR